MPESRDRLIAVGGHESSSGLTPLSLVAVDRVDELDDLVLDPRLVDRKLLETVPFQKLARLGAAHDLPRSTVRAEPQSERGRFGVLTPGRPPSSRWARRTRTSPTRLRPAESHHVPAGSDPLVTLNRGSRPPPERANL